MCEFGDIKVGTDGLYTCSTKGSERKLYWSVYDLFVFLVGEGRYWS